MEKSYCFIALVVFELCVLGMKKIFCTFVGVFCCMCLIA